MNARLMFVHTLSPLHTGSGQGVGTIDLPVSREKATGIPYLPGSSLKGVLRDACNDDSMRKAIFGPDTDYAAEHTGSVQFSDQRLLLLPVRSYSSTFAWVTSPYILKRLVRDWKSIGGDTSIPPAPPLTGVECLAPENSGLVTTDKRVILEDFVLEVKAGKNNEAERWAEWIGARVFPEDQVWKDMLLNKLVVVGDNIMNFLMETATEVTARIRLQEDTKTVAKGGLWYEESLPGETILAGLIVVTPTRAVTTSTQEMLKTIMSLINKPVQLGGKSTVGRGLCRLQMVSYGEGE